MSWARRACGGMALVLAAISAGAAGRGVSPGRAAWPLRLRGGGAERCELRDAVEEFVRNASAAAQAHAEAHADSEVQDSEGSSAAEAPSSPSEWSVEDYEQAWDQQAALRWAEGITTPHPHHLNWNMTYFNERHMDASEGDVKFDEHFRVSLWNTFCTLRDRVLKKAGVYESFFLEDGVPPPHTAPVPPPVDDNSTHMIASPGILPGVFLGEDPPLPDGGPEELEQRRRECAEMLFQGRDPVMFPVWPCGSTRACMRAGGRCVSVCLWQRVSV